MIFSGSQMRPFGQIRTMSNELLKIGGLVISGYRERDKSCNDYLNKVLEAQAKMLTLKLEEIEGQYMGLMKFSAKGAVTIKLRSSDGFHLPTISKPVQLVPTALL